LNLFVTSKHNKGVSKFKETIIFCKLIWREI